MMLEDKSETNLVTGFTMVNKAMLNIREWTGKFAEEQHKHQYPTSDKNRTKVGNAFKKQMDKFKLNVKQCSLCLTEKPKNQFYMMCKCHHEYCYNCLNTYAISKIEDSSGVVCPQQDCSETMPLTSQIYKFLPDQSKLKYLNNRQARKKSGDNICSRCLQEKHPGQCKFALKPGRIQYAYHYRQCSKCKTQVNLTEGKRRIKCSKCGHQFCYFCGTQWKDPIKGENHVCGNRGEVLRIQKQMNEKAAASCASCAECCSCDCCDTQCYCCQCDACRHCDGDFCCEVCFYTDCEECNFLCCIWNIFSIPFRLILSILIISFVIMIFGSLVFFPLIMLVGAIAAGYTCGLCEFACDQDSPVKTFLIILCCPLTGLIVAVRLMKEFCEGPAEAYGALAQVYGELFCNMWVECSPKACT